MPGYLFGPAIAEEQDTYPDVTFIAVDVTEGDIVKTAKLLISERTCTSAPSEEEQAGYLAGYAAVKTATQVLVFSAVSLFRPLSVSVTVMYRVSTLLLKKTA